MAVTRLGFRHFEQGAHAAVRLGMGIALVDGVAVGGHDLPHVLDDPGHRGIHGLVPQVGIAGSAQLGQYCVLGGQVGVIGHIKIGNMVKIGAQAGVIGDVPDGATIVGSPAIDVNKAKRAYALIETLPDMRKKIKKLEKKLKSQDG